ncbi:MAG TPA: hypothetical protein VMD92_18190 [Acidobacteriaceae bacterium]|jgi:hypothetical protein|nr:hypothetical protein [Acidobacteriaceae bacterium]
MKLFRTSLLFSSAALLALSAFTRIAPAQAAAADSVLTLQAADKLLPDTVYFAGKSANTQLRNAAGIQFADGQQTLAVLVDTSGYSSALQQKYQGYLLTETPLVFLPLKPGVPPLPPGAYGFGFVGGHFVVMDIGNHDLLQTLAIHDDHMQRPRPLQILGPWPLQRDSHISSGGYRLCSGRDCVDFRRAH